MLAFLALSLLPAPSPLGDAERPLDQVVLKSGKTLEGHVLHEGRSELLLLVGTREREVSMVDVEEVRSLPRSLAQVLDQHRAADPGDARQMLELSRFARSRGLAGLADVFALRVLVTDPQNAEAHEQLGHREHKGKWTTKGRSRSVPWERMEEVRSKWRDGWVLDTTHWELHTNLGLADAVDAATDLEHFYRDFFERFGEDMVLREVVEPMRAEIYADSKSYPPMIGRSAYFRSDENKLVVNAEGGLPRRSVVHEATHQLFYTTAVYRAGSKGCVPSWLNEGAAVYNASIAAGPRGRPSFDDERVAEAYFDVHRVARKPYKLSRMLTMSTGDFHASSKVDLKYAQAYTLVHFFLHGESGLHRDAFHEVLAGAYDGKCSSTHFKKCLDVKDKEFEAAWHAHAGRIP